MRNRAPKYFVLVLIILLSSMLNAQVGIGTSAPDESAQLDVVASDKGILIPRIALQSTSDNLTISNGNVNSLLIYNTTFAADITPGYYYWDGKLWQRLANPDDLLDAVTTSIDKIKVADGIIDINDDGEPENNIFLDDVISNMSSVVAAEEATTTLVYNENGTLTYTDEDGIQYDIDLAAIIDAKETVTVIGVATNDNGTAGDTTDDFQELTYMDEDLVVTSVRPVRHLYG